jgi:hypothetical protein
MEAIFYRRRSFAPAVRALFGELFGELRVRSSDTFQSEASSLALIATERAGGDTEATRSDGRILRTGI